MFSAWRREASADIWYNIIMNDRSQEFADLCKAGDLLQVQGMLASREPPDIHVHDDLAFRWACLHGHLDILRELVRHEGKIFFSGQKQRKSYQHKVGQGLLWACRWGRLDIVRYLLTSPDLLERPNVYGHEWHSALKAASQNGRTEIVHYLLTSPDLARDHSKAHAERSIAFWNGSLGREASTVALDHAVYHGHMDTVQYLMDGEGFEKPDIYYEDYIILKRACVNGNSEMALYLFEHYTLEHMTTSLEQLRTECGAKQDIVEQLAIIAQQKTFTEEFPTEGKASKKGLKL